MADERQQVMKAMSERATSLFGGDPSDYNEGTTFESLGIKSVQYSQLTTYLEDEFDIEVPFMKFRRKKTFGEAADYVVELLEM
ncbi:acyl carrier protein [Cryptobacterium curtum]|uniref:acyl carrier protein n=1 Tax=Cryptobacterium curtum TaxID=84163 RepID=UPI0028D62DBF|nr:acyl carrier protein [Cryptobacterium curtum]